MFFGAIVALAVCGAFRWLDNRVLREVGQKSYGMYVFHVPLLVLAINYVHLPSRLRQWAWHPLVADIIFFSFMILLTYGIAFLSYNAYEKHFLKLKRLFRSVSAPTYVDASATPAPRMAVGSESGKTGIR